MRALPRGRVDGLHVVGELATPQNGHTFIHGGQLGRGSWQRQQWWQWWPAVTREVAWVMACSGRAWATTGGFTLNAPGGASLHAFAANTQLLAPMSSARRTPPGVRTPVGPCRSRRSPAPRGRRTQRVHWMQASRLTVMAGDCGRQPPASGTGRPAPGTPQCCNAAPSRPARPCRCQEACRTAAAPAPCPGCGGRGLWACTAMPSATVRQQLAASALTLDLRHTEHDGAVRGAAHRRRTGAEWPRQPIGQLQDGFTRPGGDGLAVQRQLHIGRIGGRAEAVGAGRTGWAIMRFLRLRGCGPLGPLRAQNSSTHAAQGVGCDWPRRRCWHRS